MLWPTLEPQNRQVLDGGEAIVEVEVRAPAVDLLDDEVIGISVVALEITERKRQAQVTQRPASKFAPQQ